MLFTGTVNSAPALVHRTRKWIHSENVTEAIDILGLGSTELAETASRLLPSGAGLAGRIYARSFEAGSLDLDGLGLSPTSLSAWRERFALRLLPVIRVIKEDDKAEDGATGTAKAVLGLRDGGEIECVRIPMRGGDGHKATLCVSSQLGCRMGCAFCETGHGGFKRNLAAAEIVAQVLTARKRLGWNCGNVVFMGMGECLDNLGEVDRAIRVLTDVRGLGFSMERLSLCTSGPAGGIEALRGLGYKRLNVSISLNAGNDDKRNGLMPVNRGIGLAALAAALAAYPMRRNFALGVNWCLMPGLNDSREDAREAAAFCARVGRCLVNLIPYNPGRNPVARAPDDEDLERFASWLEEGGCLVKRRASKGGRIMAGCGQLGGIA
jgi:23S rRNA (adenine2503-C2)-methyltransferase